MLPAPNGNARLRPGDRLWVDLTISSGESDQDDAAGDNNRRRILARAGNNNGQQQLDLPPQVDINPYAPANWNNNPAPPRANPRRADPLRTPQAQNQNHQELLARIEALQQRFAALAAANQNPVNTNTNIPQSGQPTGQPVQGKTLADLITQQHSARKR